MVFPAECPTGEMWQQVATGELGPCEQTCQETNATETSNNCSAKQASGCVCQRGYFRSLAGPCVPADHCECWHHGRPHQVRHSAPADPSPPSYSPCPGHSAGLQQ